MSEWLTFAGVLVTAFVSAFNAWQNGRIHKLVNSQFSQAKHEIQEAKEEIATLRNMIAGLTNSPEDRGRSDGAAAEAAKAQLPRESSEGKG